METTTLERRGHSARLMTSNQLLMTMYWIEVITMILFLVMIGSFLGCLVLNFGNDERDVSVLLPIASVDTFPYCMMGLQFSAKTVEVKSSTRG